ncbi:class I SAM-dependent methyltransferase [uncultured Eudoraea sp.]|uniref:class I SAM-dependent methyltransferase n=1 Tax=uncultured Eudoraea sp. TaxID=1035614 RepID=UPI0026224C19|nr:class I SAM-dependent methyltransferase [uncultured Eudoraea sp.]
MKRFLKTKDYSVSGEEFELILDTELNMLRTYPEPKNLDSYYNSEHYISHSDSANSLVEKLYQYIKKYNLKRKVSLINKYTDSDKTLLDVGAGTGAFLKSAKQNGWETYGIEPSQKARDLALKKGLKLKENLDLLDKRGFQVITLWHVLEHLTDLELQIEKITSLLNNDGTLIIAVPNFKSYDAKYYKEYWAAYDVPRHLSHFSQFSISKLFAKSGMKLVKVKPLIFDSFYVSLLSEKYQHGKGNFLRAFLIGLISNIRAWKTKEYSSLLYILKRD